MQVQFIKRGFQSRQPDIFLAYDKSIPSKCSIVGKKVTSMAESTTKNRPMFYEFLSMKTELGQFNVKRTR